MVYHKRLSLINIYTLSLFCVTYVLRFAFLSKLQKIVIYIFFFFCVVNSFRFRLDKLIATLLTLCIHYIANMSYTRNMYQYVEQVSKSGSSFTHINRLGDRTDGRTAGLIR